MDETLAIVCYVQLQFQYQLQLMQSYLAAKGVEIAFYV